MHLCNQQQDCDVEHFMILPLSSESPQLSALGTNAEERLFVSCCYFPVFVAILAISFSPTSDVVFHNLPLRLTVAVPFRPLLKRRRSSKAYDLSVCPDLGEVQDGVLWEADCYNVIGVEIFQQGHVTSLFTYDPNPKASPNSKCHRPVQTAIHLHLFLLTQG